MPTVKVKQKFLRRGRQAAFARFSGVSRVTVSDWLRGRTVSARLDKLARDWKPSLVGPVSACEEGNAQAA
jgi:hypothetical protein